MHKMQMRPRLFSQPNAETFPTPASFKTQIWLADCYLKKNKMTSPTVSRKIHQSLDNYNFNHNLFTNCSCSSLFFTMCPRKQSSKSWSSRHQKRPRCKVVVDSNLQVRGCVLKVSLEFLSLVNFHQQLSQI